MIPRLVHGIIDYLVALVLLAAPFVLGFADGGAAQHVTTGLGVILLLYSIFTDYEVGLIRVLPFRLHLALDVAFALALIASPWLFGFSDLVWAPHVILGIAALCVVAITSRSAAPVRTEKSSSP